MRLSTVTAAIRSSFMLRLDVTVAVPMVSFAWGNRVRVGRSPRASYSLEASAKTLLIAYINIQEEHKDMMIGGLSGSPGSYVHRKYLTSFDASEIAMPSTVAGSPKSYLSTPCTNNPICPTGYSVYFSLGNKLLTTLEHTRLRVRPDLVGGQQLVHY